MLRSSGVETRRAAVATAECWNDGMLERVLRVTHVPTFSRSIVRSSGIPISEITVLGSWCRRFMFGYRSVPPATNIPSGPASLFIRSASVSVRGCRYRNVGSLSMHALHGFAVTAFPGCGHASRLWPRNLGKRRRSVASFFSPLLFPDGLENLLGSDGHLVYPDANGVVDRIGDRRHHRQERSLANLLRPERAVRVGIFDQIGDDVAHFERGGALVLEERRNLVHDVAVPAVGHLLHERFAEAHVDRAFDLADHGGGVDRPPDVVRDPDCGHPHNPRLWVDKGLRHAGALRIGRRATDSGPPVLSGALRRRIGTHRSDRSFR